MKSSLKLKKERMKIGLSMVLFQRKINQLQQHLNITSTGSTMPFLIWPIRLLLSYILNSILLTKYKCSIWEYALWVSQMHFFKCLKLEKKLVLYFLKPHFINKQLLFFLGNIDLTLNTHAAHQLHKDRKCLSLRKPVELKEPQYHLVSIKHSLY